MDKKAVEVQKIKRNPPSLDGVQLVLENGQEEVLSGTVWCSVSCSSEYAPNKRWEESSDGRKLVVTLNQGNPNRPEMEVLLSEEQVSEIKGHIGEGSLPS